MNFENRKNSEKEKEIQKNKEKKNDSILKRNQFKGFDCTSGYRCNKYKSLRNNFK